MSFFKQFPRTQINVGNATKTIVDLFRHVDVNDILVDEITNYITVDIMDGERPDNLSQRLYGTPEYYWTFFIVNENLKKGLDDWPKSYAAIEKEFQNEYDTISTFTIKPKMVGGVTNANSIPDPTGSAEDAQVTFTNKVLGNTLAGLDLSYEGLRVFRNYSTASIVKYDDNEMQLYLENFSNRTQFMLDPNITSDFDKLIPGDGDTGTTRKYYDPLDPGSYARFQNQNLADGRMTFTFDDWPILGVDLDNGLRDGIDDNNETRGATYLRTMTTERVEWCVELFKWYDSLVVDYQNLIPRGEAAIPGLPYEKFLKNERSLGRAQAALNVFASYFTPWYRNGNTKWTGIIPFERPDTGTEHSFLSARNAPCYYYRNGGAPFIQDDKINAFDMLNGISDATSYSVEDNIPANRITYNEINQNPLNFVSHYQKAINENEKRSRIKIIRPDLINVFAQEFQRKINEGLTRTAPTAIGSLGAGAASVGGGGVATGAGSGGIGSVSTGGVSTGGGGSGY